MTQRQLQASASTQDMIYHQVPDLYHLLLQCKKTTGHTGLVQCI